MSTRYERVARVITGVVRNALDVNGATAVVLMDDESPEGALVTRMLHDARIPVTEYADAATTLTMHPANKTALLVGSFVARVDLLPLGDLYASQVADLCGEWSADDSTKAVADLFGGIAALDALLMRHVDGREDLLATSGITQKQREGVERALTRTRFRRGRAGVVPKLGYRTIGIDLLD